MTPFKRSNFFTMAEHAWAGDNSSARHAVNMLSSMKTLNLRKLLMTQGKTSLLAGALIGSHLWPTPSFAAVGDSAEFFYTHQQNGGVALPSSQGWWLKGLATETTSGLEFTFTTAASGNTNQFFNDFVFNVKEGPASVLINCFGNAQAACQSTGGNSGDGNYVQSGSAPLGNFIATTGWELTLLNAPPPGGTSNVLNEVASNQPGETIMFSVSGLTIAHLTTNANNGYFSCTHHQGLGSNAEGSSRLCAKFGGQAPNEVPGPLPILGTAAAFGFSRRLRGRIRANA
ncbi:MAG: hypothetical protein FJ082_13895 [Cyanobacteria bacterium K_Offshore_surface_m2_011]|nr:hypothetical protein [Cyanobacteria bacterium K_Offshore_surface_m2_011]